MWRLPRRTGGKQDSPGARYGRPAAGRDSTDPALDDQQGIADAQLFPSELMASRRSYQQFVVEIFRQGDPSMNQVLVPSLEVCHAGFDLTFPAGSHPDVSTFNFQLHVASFLVHLVCSVCLVCLV